MKSFALTGVAAVVFLSFVIGCGTEQQGVPKSPWPIEVWNVPLGVAIGSVADDLTDACESAESRVPPLANADEVCDGGGVLGGWETEVVKTVPFGQLPKIGPDIGVVSSRRIVRDAMADEGWKGASVLAGSNCLCVEEKD